ncbi:AP2-ERF domain [Babesia duncani]|uniref:AP2-ERF domain n=1 Tax=Babesia duncani TaxID=323732 RepID=A0AAD9PNP7_9APIC|nr:AP2-ERF domain [Babesia duncani]
MSMQEQLSSELGSPFCRDHGKDNKNPESPLNYDMDFKPLDIKTECETSNYGQDYDSVVSNSSLLSHISSHHESMVPRVDNIGMPNGFNKEPISGSLHNQMVGFNPPYQHGMMGFPPSGFPNMLPYGMIPPPLRPPRFPNTLGPSAEESDGMLSPKLMPSLSSPNSSPLLPPMVIPSQMPPIQMRAPGTPITDEVLDKISKSYNTFRTLPQPPNFNYLDLGGGVIYDETCAAFGGRWIAFWPFNGVIWRRSFLVSMYGYEGAKELAESFWIQKMRAIQLSNRYMKEQSFLQATQKKKDTKPQIRQRAKKASSNSDMNPNEIEVDVHWDADKQCWFYEYYNFEKDRVKLKYIPVGDDPAESKNLAIQEQKQHWHDVLRMYSESPYQGLCYEKSRCCWRVAHWVPSKQVNRNRYFNIFKYGYRGAREHAKKYREMIGNLNGEEPDDWTPEPVSNSDFIYDPVTVFHHKVLNSFRAKEVNKRTEPSWSPIPPVLDNVF